MAIRRNINDFLRDIAAQSNAVKAVVYVGSINADGTVKITRNGVVTYPRVLWYDGPSPAANDATGGSPLALGNADNVTIVNGDGTISKGDAQQFIQSLV